MNAKALLLALGLLVTAVTEARAGNWDTERLHDYERAYYFPNIAGVYENSRTIKFDLGSIQCVDRLELSLEATEGAPTLFLLAVGNGNRSETLVQDIHHSTITPPPVPPAARPRDPHYPIVLRRRVSQATLAVGGGNVRIIEARAIYIPDCLFDR